MEILHSLKRLNCKRLRNDRAREEGVRRKGSDIEERGEGCKIKVYKLNSDSVRYSLPPPTTKLTDHIYNEEKNYKHGGKNRKS